MSPARQSLPIGRIRTRRRQRRRTPVRPVRRRRVPELRSRRARGPPGTAPRAPSRVASTCRAVRRSWASSWSGRPRTRRSSASWAEWPTLGEGRNLAYLASSGSPRVSRAACRSWTCRTGEPEEGRFRPEPRGHVLGRGLQVVTMDTPSFKGDLLVYQNEWCPQTTTAWAASAWSTSATRIGRRSSSRAPATSRRSPAASRAGSRRPRPTRRTPRRVAEPGQRPQVRRAGRRHGGARRRHPRHHEPEQAGQGRRVEPRLDPRRPGRRARTATPSSATTWS